MFEKIKQKLRERKIRKKRIRLVELEFLPAPEREAAMLEILILRYEIRELKETK